MPRFLGIVLLGVIILGLATFLFVRGSSLFPRGGQDENQVVENGNATNASSRKAPPPKFLQWSKPTAVLVLTGNQNGYLEPCGCSEKQAGGMARRGNLFQQLREKGWPTVGLDVGGTVQRTRAQTRLKFAAITDAMREMDYRALGLGAAELRLSPIFLLSEHVAPAEGETGLTFLGSNEVFLDTPDLPGGPEDKTIIELGGLKIGVAMVLGESEQQGLFPEGSSTDVSFTPPGEALEKVLPEFEAAETDLNVLLCSANLEESRSLAEAFPQFDLVVSGGGPEDPAGQLEEVGETRMVTVGKKGKYAGVLAIYTDEGKPKLEYELVEMNQDHFAHDKSMDLIMRDYQQSLKDSMHDVFGNLSEGSPPKGGEYVGAETCGQCHTQAFAKWKTSAHANAYESLIKGRDHFEGTWTPRNYDPECLSCHVTGWNPQEMFPYTSGFLPKELADERGQPERHELLKGQQCENCHGPGRSHSEVMAQWVKSPKSVSREEQAAARAAMTIKLDRAQCVQCHDGENSPEFDLMEYWKKIDHRGMRN